MVVKKNNYCIQFTDPITSCQCGWWNKISVRSKVSVDLFCLLSLHTSSIEIFFMTKKNCFLLNLCKKTLNKNGWPKFEKKKWRSICTYSCRNCLAIFWDGFVGSGRCCWPLLLIVTVAAAAVLLVIILSAFERNIQTRIPGEWEGQKWATSPFTTVYGRNTWQ